MRVLRHLLFAVIAVTILPLVCGAQEATDPALAAGDEQNPTNVPVTTPKDTQGASDATIENTIQAAEPIPKRSFARWNEYKGPYLTVRFSFGVLYDFAGFAQDEESKKQFAMSPAQKLRDFRFVLGGKFPQFERPITWCAGVMYDASTKSWLMRQTGIMIAVPELWGYFFIGRAKEGYSLNKVMVGYDGWTMERFTMSDATVPLLADGIKWLGYSKKHGFLWNLGYFNDVISKGQSFSSYSSQEVARLVWLPVHSVEKDTVIHIGANLRWGKPVDGQLRLKSRPEAFTAPYFLDTGTFAASSTRMAGYEVYYRKKGLLLGSEYWFQNVSSPSTGNPMFHGGDVVATWVITGETRPYNTVGGYFTSISPKKTVLESGKGAWEVVLRYSYSDLNSEKVQGGKFGRFTPMVNWYLTDNFRLEMAYGYGSLDRLGLKGNTQFFQSRIQFEF